MDRCEWCDDDVPLFWHIVNPRVWNSGGVWICEGCREYYGGES